MRAVTAGLPAADGTWAYEVKWDGVRALGTVADGRLTLHSSSGNDITARYPELVPLAAHLAGHEAIIDGEIVALDRDGVPSFGRLQARMHADPRRAAALAAEAPVSYVLFDLLWLDGTDATSLPYQDRRRLLEALVEPGPTWQVPAALHGDPADLLQAAADRGLEGVMAKRVDAPYQPGRRSADWRKAKVRRQQELVVGGFTPGTGGRAATFGALVLGVHDRTAPDRDRPPSEPVGGEHRVDIGPLRFAGKVGTGFRDAELVRLRAELDRLVTHTCPFTPPPEPAVVRGATWVAPQLVVEVAFAEWSHDDHLRHPAYLGQRDDVDPRAVVREPDPPPIDPRPIDGRER